MGRRRPCAGPAGGLAARQLALAGATVLLVEKKTFPRPKVCGACLNGRGIEVLRSVGLGPRLDGLGVPIDSLRLGMSGRVADLGLPGGLAIPRSRLDAALAAAAEEAGVAFLQGTLGELGEASGTDRAVR